MTSGSWRNLPTTANRHTETDRFPGLPGLFLRSHPGAGNRQHQHRFPAFAPAVRWNRSMDSIRAIPWVFGWSLSRHTLPAWYGIRHRARILPAGASENRSRADSPDVQALALLPDPDAKHPDGAHQGRHVDRPTVHADEPAPGRCRADLQANQERVPVDPASSCCR